MERSDSSGSATWAGPWRRISCRKGFTLVVYDVDAERRCSALEALGARAARGRRGVAAASDVVFTMLPNSAIVEEVVAGAGRRARASAAPAPSSWT